jgi:type II secretory pathway pseudopilin PulG
MEYQSSGNDSKKNYFIAALVIMAGLIGLLGYLYYQERQKNEVKDNQLAAKTRDLITTSARLDSISTQLDAKIAEIKMLGGNVEELNRVKAQLEADKQSLATASQAQIREYENKINSYVALLARKDQDIVKLREENQILTGQNQQLSQEKAQLETNLQSTRQAYADSVGTERSRNRELSEKVTIASALKAENINVYAISPKGKERDGGAYRSNRVDKVRISFALADNPLTTQENKEIFLRILDPDGAIISDMATGSGAFVHQGKETIYTAKQQVLYTNSHQNVDFVYTRGVPYKKGKHAVELYAEGFKIGQGSFEVK